MTQAINVTMDSTFLVSQEVLSFSGMARLGICLSRVGRSVCHQEN